MVGLGLQMQETKMRHGLKICFDHIFPPEVGESNKILEVLCNVLFCLHAP